MRCRECNSAMPDDARFCPGCGVAVTTAPLPPPLPASHPKPDVLRAAYQEADLDAQHRHLDEFAPPTTSYELWCPTCRTPSSHALRRDGWHEIVCPHCKKSFDAVIATVRANRSRGDKKSGTREYDMRVRHEAGEELLQFSSARYDAIEARSKDAIAISFLSGRAHVLSNYSVGQMWELRDKPTPLWAYLVLILIVVIIVAFVAS